MIFKQALVNVGKLLVGGFAFSVGIIVGGIVASLLRLQPPSLPQGADSATVILYSLLESPLLALALALLARGLGGSFLTRAFALSFLTWIAYTVNTQLEAAIFATFATGFWFTVVAFAVPALFCGVVVAFLFPSDARAKNLKAAVREFLSHRTSAEWVWRFAIAAVAFVPIYWIFGIMVVPFTGSYYQQNLYGLTMPTVDRLLATLFGRSILFLLACLPVAVMWQKSERSLFLRLGFALFVLVGFLWMLAGYWLPTFVRIPHSLEILADSFVYAAVLVLLLVKSGAPVRQAQSAVG
jgi:hypothetical protein